MNRILPLLAVLYASTVHGEELPFHPDDARIVQQIVSHQKLDAKPVVNPRKGWPQLRGEQSVRFCAKANPRHVLTVGHDEKGRVTKLIGNGPLLSNEVFRWLAKLPQLRQIRVDHNGPRPGSKVSHDQYNGSGIAALAKSKLQEIKIGHAFDDNGMRALATIKTLRVVTIGHSKITDAGIAYLANHPNIEEANFSPMGRPTITNKTLKVLATLPKLKRVGMNETFVTYKDGFEHLRPLAGRLESVTLKQTLVLPSDVKKLRADHPRIKITTSTPAEVAAKPFRRNQLLKWASPEAQAYLKTAEKE